MLGYYLESENNDYSLSDIMENASAKEWESWLNEMLDSLKETLNFDPDKNEIFIVTGEYYGNDLEGYEQNDVLSKVKVNSVQDFIDFWTPNTQKLIYHKN